MSNGSRQQMTTNQTNNTHSLTCGRLDIGSDAAGLVEEGACSGNPATAAPATATAPPGSDKDPLPLLAPPPPLMRWRRLTMSLKEAVCRSNSACGRGTGASGNVGRWLWLIVYGVRRGVIVVRRQMVCLCACLGCVRDAMDHRIDVFLTT